MAKPIRIPITFTSDPRAIKKTQQQLADFGKAAGKIVAGVGLAVAGLAVVSVKAFANFDAAMVKSTAIMGDVSDAMRNDMSAAAREVAKTTTFSAAQAAEAFFFLASAGLDAEQSIAALPKVAEFAQAGMFDMATATDLLTDAQSALGLSSDDAAENLENLANLSDILVKANTLANASVQQFSEALTNKAAASMRNLGIATEEGVAVLAVFADQGIKGSEAGTTFNATIRGMTQGVERNSAAFKEMGIEVFDAEGNFNSVAKIIGGMEVAFDGLSTEQQRAKLSQLGYTEETLNGTLALLGNSAAIREYEASLISSGGTAEQVAANQLTSFTAQLDLMKSKFADIGIEIGSRLAPSLSAFVGSMDPIIAQLTPALVGMFEALLPVFEQVLGQMPTLIEAIIPIIPAFGNITATVLLFVGEVLPILMAGLSAVVPFVTGLTGAFAENGELMVAVIVILGALAIALQAVTAIARIATVVNLGFSASMVAALGPIGLVIAALLVLTAGFVYFFGFTETGQKLWAAFTLALTKRFHEVGRQVALTVNFIIARFESMVNVAVKALNFISQKANKIDGINIPMIAEVSFGRVEVPERFTEPIEYNFAPRNLTGGPGSFNEGYLNRSAIAGLSNQPRSGSGTSPMMPGFDSSISGMMSNFRGSAGGGVSGFGGGNSSSAITNNNVTVNQGIMSGVGTSEAEAGRVIQQYLNAYSRTGGK